MTQSEFNTLLKSTGFPVAYHHFKKEQSSPYIIYFIKSSDNFMADGGVYQKINNVTVELYTEKKEPVTETILEDVLDDAGIFYEKTETYIDTEKMYQISYETRL